MSAASRGWDSQPSTASSQHGSAISPAGYTCRWNSLAIAGPFVAPTEQVIATRDSIYTAAITGRSAELPRRQPHQSGCTGSWRFTGYVQFWHHKLAFTAPAGISFLRKFYHPTTGLDTPAIPLPRLLNAHHCPSSSPARQFSLSLLPCILSLAWTTWSLFHRAGDRFNVPGSISWCYPGSGIVTTSITVLPAFITALLLQISSGICLDNQPKLPGTNRSFDGNSFSPSAQHYQVAGKQY